MSALAEKLRTAQRQAIAALEKQKQTARTKPKRTKKRAK